MLSLYSNCTLEGRSDSRLRFDDKFNIRNWKLHLCMWKIVCKRVGKIHISFFMQTICTVICWQNISLWYRKEKTTLHSTKIFKKDWWAAGGWNVYIGQSPKGKLSMEHCKNYSVVFLLPSGHKFASTSQQLDLL